MSESEDFEAVADELCTAVEALRRTDYNVLLIDDLETVIEAQRELGAMTRRYRRDQHATANEDGAQ